MLFLKFGAMTQVFSIVRGIMQIFGVPLGGVEHVHISVVILMIGTNWWDQQN